MAKPDNLTHLEWSFKQDRIIFILLGVFSCVVNLLMLTSPFYMLQVYDRVLVSRSIDTLIALSVLAVGLLVAYGMLEGIRTRLLTRLSTRMDQRVARPLLEGAVRNNLTHYGITASSWLRDLDLVKSFYAGRGLLAIYDIPWMPFYIGVIFLFHPILGIVAACGAVVMIITTALGEVLTRERVAQANTYNREATKVADTFLSNAEVIQAMGMLPRLLDRWQANQDRALANNATAQDVSGTLAAFGRFLRMGLQIAMLGVGALLAVTDQMSPGAMIAASIILGRALAPAEQLLGQWRNLLNARTAKKRLHEVLEKLDEETERVRLPRPKGRVEVENLVVVPPSQRKAVLQNVSFAFGPGEVLGVMGHSAAGKSSLARALVGAWAPVAGHVRIDGMDVAKWHPDDRGQYLGYLPQDVELFAGTIGQNIARFESDCSAQIVEAAKLAGAHDLILRLPEGYETEIGTQGRGLSGGQRQRIALARALFRRPPVLVMDEPNSNLDKEGESALRNAVVAMRKLGHTVVFIAHDSSVLSICDKLLILQDGRVVAFGPRQEVVAQLTRSVPDQQSRKPAAVTQAQKKVGGVSP